jgi:DNA replication licensing factor MCM3
MEVSDESSAKRLIVNINHLRTYSREYADGYPICKEVDLCSVLNNPMDFLPAFEQAVKEVANTIRPTEAAFYVGLEGSFGENMISPRNLNSSHLGKSISIEAIVTRCIFNLITPEARL